MRSSSLTLAAGKWAQWVPPPSQPRPFLLPEGTCLPGSLPVRSQCPLPFLKTKPDPACSERGCESEDPVTGGNFTDLSDPPPSFGKIPVPPLLESWLWPFFFTSRKVLIMNLPRGGRRDVTFHLLASFLPLEAASSYREG